MNPSGFTCVLGLIYAGHADISWEASQHHFSHIDYVKINPELIDKALEVVGNCLSFFPRTPKQT